MTKAIEFRPRHRTLFSRKWCTYDEDVLPVWVADMDFPAPVEVGEALRSFVRRRDFGYPCVPGSFAKSVQRWFRRRHGFDMSSEDIVPVSSVAGTMHHLVQHFLGEGDNYITFTPIYPPFLYPKTYRGTACVEVPLGVDASGKARIPFGRLAKSITERSRVLLFCSPHNPTGRVWERDELRELVSFCESRDLLVLSDEIWCDLAHEGFVHTPLLQAHRNAKKRVVLMGSTAKTFNLAGLSTAFLVVQDELLRERVRGSLFGNLLPSNAMSILATTTAYEACEAWLDRTKLRLLRNKGYVEQAFSQHFPRQSFSVAESTHLFWMDFSSWAGVFPVGKNANPYDLFLNEARIAFQDGRGFGEGFGGFVRLNTACEQKKLEEVFKRMVSLAKTIE